jgi:hypothetical protein
MPRPAEWFERFDPITADFTYVRWLGDRKGIEQQTKIWDKIVVDRHAEFSEWAEILGRVQKRRIQIGTSGNLKEVSIWPLYGVPQYHQFGIDPKICLISSKASMLFKRPFTERPRIVAAYF